MRITSPFGANTYDAGDYWCICDVCGWKYKRSELRVRWDKALVCAKDWEERHPQEFLQPGRDRITPQGETRPEQDAVYRETPVTQDDL